MGAVAAFVPAEAQVSDDVKPDSGPVSGLNVEWCVPFSYSGVYLYYVPWVGYAPSGEQVAPLS